MIYLDNAATSWPKPPAVSAAVSEYLTEAGGNPGRSGHRMSLAATRVVEDAREALAGLFNVSDPSRLVFTHNATHALNVALYGLLRPGDHVVTTSIEHNSVMRPLRHLETLGVELTIVSCTPEGTLDPGAVDRAMRSTTRLLVTPHGSNVVGTVVPVAALAALARTHQVPYLLDASQTAGAIPIDVQESGVDLLAFTGHKGLFGPTGTGGLYIHEDIALVPLIRGGTGSDSAHDVQPEFLPDVHESGTLNVAGIAGLAAGVRFLLDVGVDAVQARERALVARFFDAASEIAGLTVYGPRDVSQRCGVVSFNVASAMSSEVGLILDQSFGIMARTGLHCSPSAHHTLGTFPAGTVRFGFGWFNTEADVDAAMGALRAVAAWSATGVAWTA